MPYSCARFQLLTQAELARILTGLVTDLREVINHPEAPLDIRLTEVAFIVDAVAPPPGPQLAGAGETLAPDATVTHTPVPA